MSGKDYAAIMKEIENLQDSRRKYDTITKDSPLKAETLKLYDEQISATRAKLYAKII